MRVMVRMVVEMGRIFALIVVAVEGLQPIVELFAAFEGFFLAAVCSAHLYPSA